MTARTVLTTGANSGIGLATALEVARRGFRSVGAVRSESKAAVVAKAAADAGVEVTTVLLDVDDAEQCRSVVHELEPYGLVNNAGTSLTGAVEDVPDDEARALLETMVVAPMRLARLALPAMRSQGGGRIVNVSSILGRVSLPLAGWYGGAKHALEALSAALRIEVAGDGVRVVLVEPGRVETGIWERSRQDIGRRAGSRYQHSYGRSLASLGLRVNQPDAATVGSVIAGALTVRRPRSRYLVGTDARLGVVAGALLPTPVQDLLVRRALGL